jgi:hypothetical protein
MGKFQSRKKNPLGMIETSFDNGVKSTVPAAIVLPSKAAGIWMMANCHQTSVFRKSKKIHLNLLQWDISSRKGNIRFD